MVFDILRPEDRREVGGQPEGLDQPAGELDPLVAADGQPEAPPGQFRDRPGDESPAAMR